MAHAPLRSPDPGRFIDYAQDASRSSQPRPIQPQRGFPGGRSFEIGPPEDDLGDQLASSMNDRLEHETPSLPINVPARAGDCSSHQQPQEDVGDLKRPNLGSRGSSIQFAARVRLENGSRPALEERVPKLSLSTRPRGRSLMAELAAKRTGSTENLWQERSAIRHVNSARQPFSSDAATAHLPSLSASNKDGSSPTDDLLTPQDRLADVYNSPTTFTPLSGSPQSVAGSWLARYNSSRTGSVRRRSRRSITGSTQDSPAATFLRQYSSTALSPAVEAPPPDAEGQEVGEFILGKQIGVGGFSIVREAYSSNESSSQRTLAVKIVRKRIKGLSTAENEEAQALLEHEMVIWHSLGHDGILQLRSLIITEFATFAFMPLACDGSLFDAVRDTRGAGLDLDLVRVYAAHIAEALRYLHQDAKVIHRDMKLENCLVMADYDQNRQTSDHLVHRSRIVITDFGFASYLPENMSAEMLLSDDPQSPHPSNASYGSKDGKTELPPGSLHYAAPETIHPPKGKQLAPSTKPDVWALGVMLYAMITGKRPFNDSFEPKLIESIKAGDWDQDVLAERVKKSPVSSFDGNSHENVLSTSVSDSTTKTPKRAHGCRNGSFESNSLSSPRTTSSIMGNEAWARSCSTIIISDGINPEAVSEVVRGCLTTDPQARWEVGQVVNSDWLISERKFD